VTGQALLPDSEEVRLATLPLHTLIGVD